MVRYSIFNHTDLVDVARRHAPDVLLPVLAEISAAQFRGQKDSGWPYAWDIAGVARENIASSNAYRSRGPVTYGDLVRVRDVSLNLADPYIVERQNLAGLSPSEISRDPALDSLIVRHLFQQAPFRHVDPFAEIARVFAVFGQDLTALKLETVTPEWSPLPGLTLEKFVKAAFFVMSQAHWSGRFDVAVLGDPRLEEYGVTADEVIQVFHGYFAAELLPLRERARADRHDDHRMRRFDFNPLVATPFVGLGGGVYVAPSMHLAARCIGLTSLLYFAGRGEWDKALANDLGHLIEAYVGDQLRLVAPEAVTGERIYRTKQSELRTSDFVLELNGLTVVVEVKSARVTAPARLGFEAYVDHVKRDVGKAIGKQIKRTVDMIRGRHEAFADLRPQQDICGVVVTAEPYYMINSSHYRGILPDPGCPFAVVSLGELERLVVAARAGDAAALFRDLTSGTDEVGEVTKKHEFRHGMSVESNPLLDAQFSRLTTQKTATLFGGMVSSAAGEL